MSIGLCGPAGCGKNTSADILTERFGLRQASFAEPLRREVALVTMYGGEIPDALKIRPELCVLYHLVVEAKRCALDPWEKPTSPLMRKILQLWGSEFRRSEDADYWIKRAPIGKRIIYTDTRFANETSIPDELWYVWNPGAEAARGTHISEQQIRKEDCHRIIDNSGSVEDLRENVMDAYVSYCFADIAA